MAALSATHCGSGEAHQWSKDDDAYPCAECGHLVWHWCTISECCAVCCAVEQPSEAAPEEPENAAAEADLPDATLQLLKSMGLGPYQAAQAEQDPAVAHIKGALDRYSTICCTQAADSSGGTPYVVSHE